MKTICFTGMDGSGKTTQSKLLSQRFINNHIDTEVIHIFTKGNTVSSSIQDKAIFKGLYKRIKNLPREGMFVNFTLLIGLIGFFIDAWFTYLGYSFKGRKRDLIIFDRYFYDHLILFMISFKHTPDWALKLAYILPRCNATFIMTVPPEVGNRRKPEDSLEKLSRTNRCYKLLSETLRSNIIDGTKDLHSIADRLYNQCRVLTRPRLVKEVDNDTV